MIKSQYEHLINYVSIIRKQYEKNAQITGENFNVFRILGIATREVRTHSAFISELLNPYGSHGQQDVFLKLFIRLLNEKNQYIDQIDIVNVKVECEKWIGYIDKENNEGGYIDLHIKLSNNKTIIIENKIYACDQQGQLRRYYNFNKKAILIYLTLDGRKAEKYTTKNDSNADDEIQVINFSYESDIIRWLIECKKEAVNHPLIRETIAQYIYLIKHLTNQTMNDDMKKELNGMILTSVDSFESAKSIRDNFNELVNIIIPNKSKAKVSMKWKDYFNITTGEDILLFTIGEYEFKLKITSETNWHMQLAPWKSNSLINNGFGVANEEEIIFLQNLLNFNGKSTFYNQNYTIWYYFDCKVEDFLFGQDDKGLDASIDKWSKAILNESLHLISLIYSTLNKEGQCHNIKWNKENAALNKLLNIG